MPFYNELKAVVFLFQLLTRTKVSRITSSVRRSQLMLQQGAEPIYIHVLRPLIKPYVATLDYALDLLHGLGDFMMLVLSLPYHLLMDWWHPKQRHLVDSDSSDSNQDEPLDAAASSIPVGAYGNANLVGVRTRRSRPMSRPQTNAVAGPSNSYSTSRTNNIVPSRSDPTVKAVRFFHFIMILFIPYLFIRMSMRFGIHPSYHAMVTLAHKLVESFPTQHLLSFPPTYKTFIRRRLFLNGKINSP